MNAGRQAGLSPVEILVALALGLFLTATVLQVYLANKQTYRVVNASARLQENARFGAEVMSREIRMAGYQGCAGSARNITNQLQDSSSFLYDFGTAVQGFDATGTNSWTPALDNSISSVLSGSDVLTIRGLFGREATITDSADPGNCENAALVVDDSDNLMQSDIVIAGNCGTAAVFQISTLADTSVAHAAGGSLPGNAGANLSACYAGAGTLGRLSTRSFYIRDNAAGVSSLYRTDISGANTRTEELIEGIEGMQVLYGIDTDSDSSINQFVSAADVATWNQVSSVRVSLLLRSNDDNLTTDAQPYYFNGSSTDPADRKLRSVVTTTIGLRNRLP